VVVGNSGADALDPVMDDGGAYLGLLFGWTMPDAGEDLKLGDEQVPAQLVRRVERDGAIAVSPDEFDRGG